MSFEADYFRTVYRDYERQNPPRKLRFYRTLVERAADGVGRPRVLDIGCAFGRFLGTLDARWERCGVDVSQHAVERARQSLPEVPFAIAGATAIPFAGPFDVITAFDVLEHVPDIDAARAEILRKLGPSGQLVFVVPVYDGPLGPVVRRLDRDRTHVHCTSRRSWLDWARRGFDVAEWCGVFRYLVPGAGYLHWPSRALRAVAPAIAVRARRGASR